MVSRRAALPGGGAGTPLAPRSLRATSPVFSGRAVAPSVGAAGAGYRSCIPVAALCLPWGAGAGDPAPLAAGAAFACGGPGSAGAGPEEGEAAGGYVCAPGSSSGLPILIWTLLGAAQCWKGFLCRGSVCLKNPGSVSLVVVVTGGDVWGLSLNV